MVAVLVEQEGKIMAYRSLVKEGIMIHLSSSWTCTGNPSDMLSYNPFSPPMCLSSTCAGSIRILFSGLTPINRITIYGNFTKVFITVEGIGDKITFPIGCTHGVVGWDSGDFDTILAGEVKIEEETGPIEIRGIDIYQVEGDYVSDASGMVLPIDRIDVRKPKVYEESPIKIEIKEI
jgi:hypothetical protein